jgi:hypothetical protein
MNQKTKKLLILNLPYVLIGLFCTNVGEAWRIASGSTTGEKILDFLTALGEAFANPLPSLHPFDLCVGLAVAVTIRAAVYLKGKNAKKYRHGQEYGSARWGTAKDIEPFADPVFENNVILTKTESLTMNSRPADPKTARNKNVLIIGGSGSGKTRFWLKPNLLQCTSKSYPTSFVVTDPKGYNTGVQRKYRMYESNATFSLYSIFDGLNIKRKEKCPWKQRQSSVPPFMNGFPEMMNCKANRTVSRIRRTIWKNMPVLRDSSISGILQMMDFPGLRSIVPDFKP